MTAAMSDPGNPDRDLCARCGNQFPRRQSCDGCRTDAELIQGALHVLRKNRRFRNSLTGGVFIRVLERYADRLEDGTPP